jgi:hypothetical protein
MANTKPTLWEQLAAPFDPQDVKLRPLEVKTIKDWKKPDKKFGKYTEPCRAKYAVYIDARNVEDRLDAVVGPAAWKDEYRELRDSGMLCRLWVKDPESGEWLYHEGIGYPNAAGDDEPGKGAESDSLKRAAVKYGIGRDLYSMTEYMGLNLAKWHDCDEYGQPGRIEQPAAPKAEPKSDPVTDAYRAVMAIAELKGTKDAVRARLGDPKNGKDALAAFDALTLADRTALERIAEGEAA